MKTDPDKHRMASGSRRRSKIKVAIILLLIWAAAAYILTPLLWKAYFKIEPNAEDKITFDGVPTLTHTSDGHPGDPVNLALIGTESDVVHALHAAKWEPADPLSFDTSVKIAVDSVFRRPDLNAPVSNLFLFDRKQDLAFEQEIGESPRQRRHVRFWRTSLNGYEIWIGAATIDDRVGLSYTTGQVTHHIDPNVDGVRNLIVDDLTAAGWVLRLKWIDGFHRELDGRNGGGDPWRSDGRLAAVLLGPKK